VTIISNEFRKMFITKFGFADKRNRKMSEAVTGIKVIKFNAWEEVMKKLMKRMIQVSIIDK